MPQARFYQWAPNHNSESPSHVVSVAVVSKRLTTTDTALTAGGTLEFSGCYTIASRRKRNGWYGRTERFFATSEEFWAWLQSRQQKRESCWLFCHNWNTCSQLLAFWAKLDDGTYKLGLPSRETSSSTGKAVTIKAWKGLCAIDSKPWVVFATSYKGTLKLIDVRNYYDIELPELARSFGVTLPRVAPVGDETANGRAFAEAECEAVHVCMTRTIDAWASGDRGNWQPTAGRLAESNYRHEFMKDHVIQIDEDKMDRPFHRSAIYGGEVQAFYRGFMNGPLYHVDCTGLYPATMLNGNFPCGIRQHHPVGSVIGRTGPLRPNECIAAVRVHALGDVPCRRDDGRVVYPTGLFDTVLAGPELAVCVAEGRVKEWYGWTWFKMAPIFSRYVEYWWAIRKQAKATGDAATDALAKIMLNCLWGRFCTMSSLWNVVPDVVPPVRWGGFIAPDSKTGKWAKYRSIAGVSQMQGQRSEKRATFPAVGAFVCAEARVYMRRVRELCPSRSIICQQTDSLIVDERGYDAILGSVFWGEQQLGCFRDVDTIYWINIRAANQYTHDKGACLSGCPENRVPTGDNRWSVEIPETAVDAIARGGPGGTVRSKKLEYVINPQYDACEYGPDGWRIF